ncbi:hypothetical protein QJS10_CPB11g00562 [Acorus calamus]|uniref:Uncharacterized protein n=1 Tax=Acorus calamus TaxID=4465 RepID=A0AAV9DQM3_ACOCL|nr:hypothetical protein QJS10_CPB11g00562 [Acorus calamus]
MICSVSSSSSSTSRSGPSWLDRLRHSKGFPPDDGLDLDVFVTSNLNPNLQPNPDIPSRPSLSDGHQRNRSSTDLFGLMSSVLSELFIMGDPPKIRPKALRKQQNPRPRAQPSSDADESVPWQAVLTTVPSADISGTDCRRSPEEEKAFNKKMTLDESDLSGYSCTRVTVIDTSAAEAWKSEKVVFRKGMVWKFRDKKRGGSGSGPPLSLKRKRKFGQVAAVPVPLEKRRRRNPMRALKASSKNGCTGSGVVEASKVNQLKIPSKRPSFLNLDCKPSPEKSPVLTLQDVCKFKKKKACLRSRHKMK